MAKAQGVETTFFQGTTADSVRWVLSYEGGPTAASPETSTVVSGNVGRLSFPVLTIEQGMLLRSLLPSVDYREVPALLWDITTGAIS